MRASTSGRAGGRPPEGISVLQRVHGAAVGGDFLPAHVSAFKRQLDQHAPAATLYCLTDMADEITAEGVNCIELQHGWPGWWSKMELFRPDIDVPDMLYFDLDTMILGDIEPLLEEDRFLMLRDWLRPHGLNSSVMSLPRRQRNLTWMHWQHHAADFIAKYSSLGRHLGRSGRPGDPVALRGPAVAGRPPRHDVQLQGPQRRHPRRAAGHPRRVLPRSATALGHRSLGAGPR